MTVPRCQRCHRPIAYVRTRAGWVWEHDRPATHDAVPHVIPSKEPA